MRHFKGYVKTDRVGSKVEFEFDVDDNATEETIQKIANECMWENLEMCYWEQQE